MERKLSHQNKNTEIKSLAVNTCKWASENERALRVNLLIIGTANF